MAERNRHQHRGTTKGESKAHSQAHKYDERKMSTVVNHNFYERNHGFESTHHKGKKPEGKS